ncbi:MAG: WYL domain-containing protein [Syntrophomonadaceae bacterium]|nr:WYL domain-containing protein [Syntrophomonadaceae bacterium]
MFKKNRTAAMAESTIRLRNYMMENPDLPQEDVMEALKIGKEASLYSLLSGLGDDPEMCINGEFLLRQGGKRLTKDEVEEFLTNSLPQGKDGPKLAERLLYLYWCLHKAIPYGGLTFKAIQEIYIKLYMDSGNYIPKVAALKRMIYRDMEELEKSGIAIDRSETGRKKYRLTEDYLPSLTAESAAAVYASMLLYRNTLLDEATLGAKEEIEKSFFNGFPERSKVLKERIYVLGDTLANPQEFGNLIGKLIGAVGECFRIKITYINNDGEESERLLEPLGLVSKRNVWYLIAHKVGSSENRTFRVDQILHLNVRDSEKFVYPKDFSLTEHIGCSWGVFYNDEVEIVKLKFSPQVAYRVKNLHYHPSQRIAEECADGSVILEFEVCGLVEMQSWILQWGPQVEVLGPIKLREEIRETARSILKKYRAKRKKQLK